MLNSDFEKLVVADSHGDVSEEQAAELRGPLLDEWVSTLTTLIIDVDAQFSASKQRVKEARTVSLATSSRPTEEFREIEAYEADWHRRAVSYKKALMFRLAEAKKLQKMRNVEVSRNSDAGVKRRLITAIRMHKTRVEEEYEPTPADIALWDVLADVLADYE